MGGGQSRDRSATLSLSLSHNLPTRRPGQASVASSSFPDATTLPPSSSLAARRHSSPSHDDDAHPLNPTATVTMDHPTGLGGRRRRLSEATSTSTLTSTGARRFPSFRDSHAALPASSPPPSSSSPSLSRAGRRFPFGLSANARDKGKGKEVAADVESETGRAPTDMDLDVHPQTPSSLPQTAHPAHFPSRQHTSPTDAASSHPAVPSTAAHSRSKRYPSFSFPFTRRSLHSPSASPSIPPPDFSLLPEPRPVPDHHLDPDIHAPRSSVHAQDEMTGGGGGGGGGGERKDSRKRSRRFSALGDLAGALRGTGRARRNWMDESVDNRKEGRQDAEDGSSIATDPIVPPPALAHDTNPASEDDEEESTSFTTAPALAPDCGASTDGEDSTRMDADDGGDADAPGDHVGDDDEAIEATGLSGRRVDKGKARARDDDNHHPSSPHPPAFADDGKEEVGSTSGPASSSSAHGNSASASSLDPLADDRRRAEERVADVMRDFSLASDAPAENQDRAAPPGSFTRAARPAAQSNIGQAAPWGPPTVPAASPTVPAASPNRPSVPRPSGGGGAETPEGGQSTDGGGISGLGSLVDDLFGLSSRTSRTRPSAFEAPSSAPSGERRPDGAQMATDRPDEEPVSFFGAEARRSPSNSAPSFPEPSPSPSRPPTGSPPLSRQNTAASPGSGSAAAAGAAPGGPHPSVGFATGTSIIVQGALVARTLPNEPSSSDNEQPSSINAPPPLTNRDAPTTSVVDSDVASHDVRTAAVDGHDSAGRPLPRRTYGRLPARLGRLLRLGVSSSSPSTEAAETVDGQGTSTVSGDVDGVGEGMMVDEQGPGRQGVQLDLPTPSSSTSLPSSAIQTPADGPASEQHSHPGSEPAAARATATATATRTGQDVDMDSGGFTAATLDEQAAMLTRLLSVATAATAASLVPSSSASLLSSGSARALGLVRSNSSTSAVDSATSGGGGGRTTTGLDRLSSGGRSRSSSDGPTPGRSLPAMIREALNSIGAYRHARTASRMHFGSGDRRSVSGSLFSDERTSSSSSSSASRERTWSDADSAESAPLSGLDGATRFMRDSIGDGGGTASYPRPRPSSGPSREREREREHREQIASAPGEPGSFDRFLHDMQVDLGVAVRSIGGEQPGPGEVDVEARLRRRRDFEQGQLSFFRVFRFDPVQIESAQQLAPAPPSLAGAGGGPSPDGAAGARSALLGIPRQAGSTGEATVPSNAPLSSTSTSSEARTAATGSHARMTAVPLIVVGVRSIPPGEMIPGVPEEDQGMHPMPPQQPAGGGGLGGSEVRDGGSRNEGGDGVRTGGGEAAGRLPPPTSRFLLFVSGGRYPVDHPILSQESHDAGRDLVNLINMLGAFAMASSKPATVTRDEIARSGLEVFKGRDVPRLLAEGKIRENTAERCLICLAEWQDEDDCRLLDCKHLFHSSACVDQWLSQSSNTCPVCRQPAVKGDRDEGGAGEATAASSSPPRSSGPGGRSHAFF